MKTIATEENAEQIAAPEAVEVTLSAEDDLQARYEKLETEKENYKNAYLKSQQKRKESDGSPLDEDAAEMMRRIAKETLEESQLAELTREQDELIKKALKENKELKLAQLNKTDIPVTTTSSTEATAEVRDTLVTPDQLASFKAKGWTDKDIQRYKDTLRKNTR